MKKLLLLCSAFLTAGFANAQLARQSMVASENSAPAAMTHLPAGDHKAATNFTPREYDVTPHSGARTTLGGGRWYNYDYDFLQFWQMSLGHDINFISEGMWNDTTALWGYTGTFTGSYYPYEFNQMKSVGIAIDPSWAYYNYADGTGSTTYPIDWSTLIGVRPGPSGDAYTIDSVEIVGWYTRSTLASKTGVVDTLIVTFVQGNGGATTDLPAATITGTVVPKYCASCSSLNTTDMMYDATYNRAAHQSGSSVTAANAVYKFLLYGTDSNALAPNNALFPRPATVARPRPVADPVINYPVSAGNSVGISVAFKSGDAGYHATGGHPGDTIRISNTVIPATAITETKYSYWEQMVYYAVPSTGSTTAEFCSGCYDPSINPNMNSGYFDIEGNGWPYAPTKYTPNWDIITSLVGPTANAHQFPNIGMHIQCATCLTLPIGTLGTTNVKAIDEVKAFPNPANNVFNVTFATPQNTEAKVSLTNMLGQVVATQTVTNGRVVFNTADLAEGIYLYAIESNGTRSTGHVSIAH